MDSFDLKSYMPLFLQEAKAYVVALKQKIEMNPKDVVELHRIAHTLKGQCMFMGYQELGYIAYDLQKLFKLVMDKEKAFDENILTMRSLIGEIETKLNQIQQ